MQTAVFKMSIKRLETSDLKTAIKDEKDTNVRKQLLTLCGLRPFCHNGTMHAGGRLQNSICSPVLIHPPILPSMHHGKKLIVLHFHEKVGHGGYQHTHLLLQQHYRVIHVPTTVKHYIKQCFNFRCLCDRRGIGRQIMATCPNSESLLVFAHLPALASIILDRYS